MLITVGPSTAAPAKAEPGRTEKLIAIAKARLQKVQFIRGRGCEFSSAVWKVRLNRHGVLRQRFSQPWASHSVISLTMKLTRAGQVTPDI